MKNDEFEKLDAFMKRNVPQMSKKSSAMVFLSQKRFGWLEYGLAFGLFFIVSITMYQDHKSKLENAEVVSEVLEMDFNVEDSIDDMDVLAMIE